MSSSRSHRFLWLLAKEMRELLASRAYWLLLLAAGLLTGHAFLTAVDTYAEMSGGNGAPGAMTQGLSPLDGILVPTFGVLWLTATLLLPFVVIRLIARERQNGAWKLLAQGPLSMQLQLWAKILVLMGGWIFCWVPALFAVLLWKTAGNHLSPSELLSVLLGHALFAILIFGVTAAAAAMADGEATAAIVALGFTIGTWALDFIGAARGGLASEIAQYSPTTLLRGFEEGLLRMDAVAVMLMFGVVGLSLALTWSLPGLRLRHRLMFGGSVIVIALVLLAILTTISHATRDLSENRRNSFALADEKLLQSIREPLRVEIHLAPQDPRMADFHNEVLEKLKRVLPSVQVTYVSQTHTGMFEPTGEHYGEIFYRLGDKEAVNRSTISSVVLGVIYQMAGITTEPEGAEMGVGFPLVSKPKGIAIWYFVVWPLIVAGLGAAWRMKTHRSGI